MDFYATDPFFQWMYDNSPKGIDLEQADAASLPGVLAAKRQRLKELLTFPQIEKLGFLMNIRPLQTIRREDYTIEAYTWEILPHLVTSFYILKPLKEEKKTADGKIKAVIYCRGHGNGSLESTLINNYPDSEAKSGKYPPLRLVKEGYYVFVPEFMGYQKSRLENFRSESDNNNLCYGNQLILSMYGISLMGVRVYNVCKTVDYIQEQYHTDCVGIIGISGGGMITQFSCAAEERLKAGVVMSYPNTFRDSIMAIRHCCCNYVPGILEIGESPDILALSLPKPLLLCTGDKDPIFPLEGAKKSYETVRDIYGKAGMADRVQLEIFDGGHELSDAVYPHWFADNL